MPIYAYRCATCGHDFDRLQKMSDPDPEKCPDCGADTVKRQLTAPSFRLSGSGWYETDFKKDSDKKRNLTEGGEGSGKPKDAGSSGDGKSGEGKSTDSKPADAKPAPSPAAKADTKTESKPKPAAE